MATSQAKHHAHAEMDHGQPMSAEKTAHSHVMQPVTPVESQSAHSAHGVEHAMHTMRGGTQSQEGDHAHHADHTGHEGAFRRRFWGSLLLSLPVLLYTPMLQMWLWFRMPEFAGSQCVAP